MKGFPLTVFLLLLFTSLNAQTIIISGKLVDAETANLLPYANIQLYEAITYLIVFGLMYYLYRTKREKLQNGFFFGLAITLIFVVRFFIEFIKGLVMEKPALGKTVHANGKRDCNIYKSYSNTRL